MAAWDALADWRRAAGLASKLVRETGPQGDLVTEAEAGGAWLGGRKVP